MAIAKKRTTGRTAHSSGVRTKAAPAPVPAAGATKLDPEVEGRVYALVRRVADDDGMTLPPEWLVEADHAKRRGYLNENNLRLFITLHGRQWIASKDSTAQRRGHTMQKLSPGANLQLKDLAHDTGVPMKELVGHLIGVVHENRDRLTRYARKHGADHPWEAIPIMIAALKLL
jgi:hypothetical protein